MRRIIFVCALTFANLILAQGQLPFVDGKPHDKPEAKPVKIVKLGLPTEMIAPPLPEVKIAPPPRIPGPPRIVTDTPAPAALDVSALAEPLPTLEKAPESMLETVLETPLEPERETASTPSPSNTSEADGSGVCHYVVKSGDNLSRILLKLGMLPIYGKQGNLRSVIENNPEKVRNDGNLILPKVRIAIPANLVASNEMCVGAEEKDVRRRIALYSQAEAEIRKGKYEALCRKVLKLAKSETEKEKKGRFMHLAAVCQYEEKNFTEAHRLWEAVLALQVDASLQYRASYNLALVECYTDKAPAGYERLRNVSPQLWQTQDSAERRTFLDLAVYCAEKAVGPQARLETIVGVYKSSPEAELRDYAEEKLRGDFVNPRQNCDLLKATMKQLSEDPQAKTWEKLWEDRCD